VTSRDEKEARARFAERYVVPTPLTMADIERRVLGEGKAWGVNGYTTVAQADALGRALELGPGRCLLDVGTGRGYPGLYLAAKTGCSVVGTDLPHEPLVAAIRKAGREQLESRAAFVAAGGRAQPFREGSFDAVVLTDVLCCLRAKLAVLRSLKRLLRPGGRIALTTIYVTAGLPPAARRRANRSGPRAVASRAAPPQLLASAGFVDIDEVDLTPEFATTGQAWVEQWDQNADELIHLEGLAAFGERQRGRRMQLCAIEDGLLRRGLFWARRPL